MFQKCTEVSRVSGLHLLLCNQVFLGKEVVSLSANILMLT